MAGEAGGFPKCRAATFGKDITAIGAVQPREEKVKRKYEVETKIPGLTVQVEESECPGTITLSVIWKREEIFALSLSREAWQEMSTVGTNVDAYGPRVPFTWAEAPNPTEKANG